MESFVELRVRFSCFIEVSGGSYALGFRVLFGHSKLLAGPCIYCWRQICLACRVLEALECVGRLLTS